MLKSLRQKLAGWRWRWNECVRFQQRWGDLLSWRGRWQLFTAHWQHLAGYPGPHALHIPGYPHPVHFRGGTSDLAVIEENLLKQQYAVVGQLGEVRTILDCGGNIGTASLYFLRQYPRATVAIVEPDPDNLTMIQRNLAAYRERVRIIPAGVWSHTTSLKVARGEFRDGQAWSVQVREAKPGEVDDVQAFSMQDLLAQAGFEFVDLLKVDIEGAERVVFLQAQGWLPRVRNIIIEIHDDECNRIVSAALASGFDRSEHGELTLFRQKSNLA